MNFIVIENVRIHDTSMVPLVPHQNFTTVFKKKYSLKSVIAHQSWGAPLLSDGDSDAGDNQAYKEWGKLQVEILLLVPGKWGLSAWKIIEGPLVHS